MKTPFLENDIVRLSLLDLNNFSKVQHIAFQKDLIYFSPSDISTIEKLKLYVESAVTEYYKKTAIPFIIFDKITNSYAGSTRFGHIDWNNKVLHIGWTWIGKEFQGSGLNLHMKFLMLQYAFEDYNLKKWNSESTRET